MKLILTQEVSGLGEPGDVVTVKDGYGRNYLLPRGMATPWTRGGQKQVDSIRAARKAREIQSKDAAASMKGSLQAKVVRVRVRAGKDGRLFGAVTPALIADAIAEAKMGTLDRRKLEIPTAIRSTGQYEIMARLHPEVSAKVRIDVVAAAS